MTPRVAGINRKSPWIDKFLHYAPTHLPADECWEWGGYISVHGYGAMQVGDTLWRTHRLSCALHNGDLPAGAHICHHCDNRKCVNPQHLYAGDVHTNIADKVARNRLNPARGSRQGSARLTEADVTAIRADWATGQWLQKELAIRYGISPGVMSKIVRRRLWRHVA